MATVWVPSDFSEDSRQWSVLKDISANLLTGYICAPSAPLTSNFRTRYPTGEFKRPVVVFEKLGGAPGSVVMGGLGRVNSYQLTVMWPERMAAGVDAGADRVLNALNEELLRFLHGRRIPFYDYMNLSAPRRVESSDFQLLCLGDQRESEKNDRERNILVMRFQCEI